MILRRAVREDAEQILAWRNDRSAVEASLTRAPVSRSDHLRWLESVLNDPDHLLLIGEVGGEAVGSIRFDRIDAKTWEISINVAPQLRGKGLGSALIRRATALLDADEDQRVVVAKVRVDNERSRRAFERAGYVMQSQEKEIVMLVHYGEGGADANA